VPELYWWERNQHSLNEPLPNEEPDAAYGVNLSVTMPLACHVVRVVASAGASIRRYTVNDDANNAPGWPMVYEFAIRNYGPPARTSGGYVYLQHGAMTQSGVAVVSRNPPGGSFGTVIDTVSGWEANPGVCDAKRSDGQIDGPTGVQLYTLQLVLQPLARSPIAPLPVKQFVSWTANLRVLFEHDGDPGPIPG